MKLKNFLIGEYKNGSWILWCMAIPCVIFFIMFSYVPLFGWLYAFFDYKPAVSLFQCDFVGLKYFKRLFAEPEVWTALRNTLALSFLGMLTSPLSVIFAILLTEFKSLKFQKTIQTVTTFPNFISWIIIYSIALIFFSVDDGALNKVLLSLGWIDQPTNLLANKDAVWPLQTILGIWKGLGFGSIVYFAAISGIDGELYDAASVDGAGRFQKIWHIKVPGVMPTFVVLFLLGIGGILNSGFEQLYVFYNPAVHETIQTLDLYVYKIGIERNSYSFSTAIGITKTLVSLVLLTFANWTAKKVRGNAIL